MTPEQTMQQITDLIAADPAVSPAFAAALSDVRVVKARCGTGGLISITGRNRAAVEARARTEADSYCPYAYGTSVGQCGQVDDEYEIVVRWYSAD